MKKTILLNTGLNQSSVGTLGDAWKKYQKVKLEKRSYARRDRNNQDRSCVKRIFGTIAVIMGVANWKTIPIESVSIVFCDLAHDYEIDRKDCDFDGRIYAIIEDFRVCAKVLRVYGVSDENNPFWIVRKQRYPERTDTMKTEYTLPRIRNNGKVCEKEVQQSKRECPGRLGINEDKSDKPKATGLGIKYDKGEPEMVGESKFVHTIEKIESGTIITSDEIKQ